ICEVPTSQRGLERVDVRAQIIELRRIEEVRIAALQWDAIRGIGRPRGAVRIRLIFAEDIPTSDRRLLCREIVYLVEIQPLLIDLQLLLKDIDAAVAATVSHRVRAALVEEDFAELCPSRHV